MMMRLKNNAGPTSTAASVIEREPRRRIESRIRVRVLPGFDALVRVLDHDDCRIHHRADRDRDAAERHDVGVDALIVHDDEGDQYADRQRNDRDQR